MGQIRKLDKEGMRSRADKQNLGDSSWRCFKLADQTLADIDGILSKCKVEGVTVPRYESLADTIGKLEEDCKKLLDYPEDLIEELDAVDTTFDNNVNNALNSLSAIKLDDIKVKNTFDVTITQHFDPDAISMGDESVDIKKDLTLADFIGYFDGYAFGRETSFVKGFTDVLYSEDISKGKTLQELLKDNKESLKELLYGSEFDVKKYAPKGEYASEIAGDIPGGLYPLGKAIYGYDFFTQDRLTEQERVIEGLEGVIDLALLMLLWGKADGAVKAATDFLSLAGSNVARTGSEHLCEDLGASTWTTLLVSSTVGALTFVTGEAAGMKYEQFYNSQNGIFDGIDKDAAFPSTRYETVRTYSAEETNNWFIENVKADYEPPYSPNTTIEEIRLITADKFVRVYDKTPDGSNMYGNWVMRLEDIKGLTAHEIQIKYSLPKEPVYICDVYFEPETHLRRGIANAIEGWGTGGKMQYDLMGQRVGVFENERLLEVK